MPLKAGDKVAFLHEKGQGTVIKVLSALKVLIELEGIEIEVSTKELVQVKDITLSQMTARQKDPLPTQAKSRPKSKPHSKDVLVIDLHAEKLNEHSFSMSNQQKLSLQLDHFQESLERAINGHISKIVFIHGVGNGILRQSIRDILKRYEGIEFSDGSYQKYGAGATEVRITSRNQFRESF